MLYSIGDKMVHKIFSGRYIDLDKLLSISDVYLSADGAGCIVVFDMHFQLLENPIKHTEYLHNYTFEYFKDEETVRNGDSDYEILKAIGKERVLKPLQDKVNEIVKVWEVYKNKALDVKC